MSPRSVTHGLLALGILAGDAPVVTGDVLPDWIKITPRGDVTTRDGRGLKLSFNPDALVTRFGAEGVDVALDLDHAIAIRAPKGERADAIGYATTLNARADGTYAKVDWNDGGKAVLKARTHRYVSPSVYHLKETNAAGFHDVTGLHSISLVTAPALSMSALLSALGYDDTPEPFMKQVAKALGLAETATEDQCLAALQGRIEIKPIAKKLGLDDTATSTVLLKALEDTIPTMAPIAKALGLDEKANATICLAAIADLKKGGGDDMIAQLQSQLRASGERVTKLEKSARDKEVGELLDGALKDRKIVPAQRESYVGLCATDDGLKHVRSMLAATPAGLQDSGLGGRPPGADDEQDPATLAAAATKLQKEREAAGQPIGYAEAVALAAKKKG